MSRVTLSVNGEQVEAAVEPRTHLADFLREHCNLTGTHLGCEHGVCGACTVLLDDAPVRSCITYAVACDGMSVRTVEGFTSDPLMDRLRDAFTREHALQCGYCTPGMLATAYDIARRLPQADEARIRAELAGNICRCTGYMGIVAAIKRVLAEMPDRAVAAPAAADMPPPRGALPRFAIAASGVSRTAKEFRPEAEPAEPVKAGWSRVAEGFTLDRPPAEVWSLFADVVRVAACMPGARVDSFDGQTLTGRFETRMGPIRSAFSGRASFARDDARMTGRITGGGEDANSSRAEGMVVYRVMPGAAPGSSEVTVTMDFRLEGALAQFGRSGVVRDLIRRIIADFARNVAALAAGREPAALGERSLDIGNLAAASLWTMLKSWIARRFGGRG